MKASDFASLLPDHCSEVLDAMYFTTILEATIEPNEAASEIECAQDRSLPQADDFAFQLRYTGDVSGRFGLCLGASTARSLAANFLGEEETDISPTEVSEVVGELANMLCGAVMSVVPSKHKFVLSHPEPTLALPHSCAQDMVLARLETDSGDILTWIIVEGNA